MTEHPLTVDAREAKGLHDGSITRIVRVVEFPDGKRQHWPDVLGPYAAGFVRFTRPVLDWFKDVCIASPLGNRGDRLRAVCEPGEPCEHRGCQSHVTHVCEVCGRGWAGILLEVTDVRVIRVQDVTAQDAYALGFRCECIAPIPRCGGNVLTLMAEIGEAIWESNAWVWLGTVAKVEQDRKTLAGKHSGG